MRRRSQRTAVVIILYFGTSARSLSYVDCANVRAEARSGQYKVFFASTSFLDRSNVSNRRRVHPSARARSSPALGLAPSSPARAPHAARSLASLTHLFEEDLVVGLLLHLTLGPLLRSRNDASSSSSVSRNRGRAVEVRRDRRLPPPPRVRRPPRAAAKRTNEAKVSPRPLSPLSSASRDRRTRALPREILVAIARVSPAPSLVRVVVAAPSCPSYRRPRPWRPWRPSIPGLSAAS